VDDLCDGGATFIGAAKCLRDAGAKFVGLVVPHGIFSRGVSHVLDNGIDHIHTSNSFKDWTAQKNFTVTTLL
jgi:ribose-phosphate pyrophosphokinase